MQHTILVFGAHPDDAEIGMGGTIKRLTADGNEVILVIATIPDEHEKRMKEAEESAKILGIKEVILLPLGIEELGYNRKTIGMVDRVISRVKPYAVFTHWVEDSHQDHVNLSKCVIGATRKNNFHVLMYENTIPGGLTPAAFRAQYIIDISQYIHHKLACIKAHASQIIRNGDWWIEGIKGRAMYRGYQIHKNFAEAFEIVKIKDDVKFFRSPVEPTPYELIDGKPRREERTEAPSIAEKGRPPAKTSSGEVTED